MANGMPKPETDQDLIDALAALLESDEGADQTDSVDEELRSAGYDPAEIGARMARVAEDAYTSSPYNWRRRAAAERAEAERTLRERSLQREQRGRSEVLGRINEIISRVPDLGQSGRVQAHFRNLDEATDEDLEDLLTELEFLEDMGPEEGA